MNLMFAEKFIQANNKKHEGPHERTLVKGIHRWKGPTMRNVCPCHDFIIVEHHIIQWWRHGEDTHSALLVPYTGGIPSQNRAFK